MKKDMLLCDVDSLEGSTSQREWKVNEWMNEWMNNEWINKETNK